MKRPVLVVTFLACLTLWTGASPVDAKPVTPTKWTVEGVEREALVILPSKRSDAPAPVLLVFHGHGGTMRSMERHGFQALWPEAIVICPQGLPTVTGRDPEGKRSGWQPKPGDNKDRDVKFVDAILKTLREKYKVDDRRIYVTGHSNGGGFTYLLWRVRGKEFAAIAPSAAGAGSLRASREVKPLPVLHLAGKKDTTVPFENQQRTMAGVRKFNGCQSEGKAWAKEGNLVGTLYPSTEGTPFVSVIHPGTHKYPAEAPRLIVQFFKEHAKPAGR